MTGFHRCRAHMDRLVTWRGKGCPDCAAERASSMREKAVRRAAARALRQAKAGAR